MEKKSGKELRLSSDAEYLTLDIESVTGEHIGVNTLKRLLGLIDDERTPRPTTLNIIARYLDFESWDILKLYDEKSNSSFDRDNDEIRVTDLEQGSRIEISYLPDRRIVIEYAGNYHFVVVDSENSKLQKDDHLKLTHIVRGYPLLVSEVIRDGENLGSFMAGKAQGIDFELM